MIEDFDKFLDTLQVWQQQLLKFHSINNIQNLQQKLTNSSKIIAAGRRLFEQKRNLQGCN